MTVLETPSDVVAHRRVTLVVLTVLAAALFAVGWVVGAVSVPLSWAWAAVRVGWSDGRRVGRR